MLITIKFCSAAFIKESAGWLLLPALYICADRVVTPADQCNIPEVLVDISLQHPDVGVDFGISPHREARPYMHQTMNCSPRAFS